jgi:predicted HAD superfamily Cof-like phosphohydrolase
MSQSVDLMADIAAFHEKFQLQALPKPGFLGLEQTDFRLKFLDEELDELKHSIVKQDLPGALDAIVDLVYVALGTAYLMNLPFNEAWAAVQQANMAKVRTERAEDSKRGSTFDVVKPAGWTAPDIGKVIEQYELQLEPANV